MHTLGPLDPQIPYCGSKILFPSAVVICGCETRGDEGPTVCLLKKSTYKWSCAGQTCVVQGSTVICLWTIDIILLTGNLSPDGTWWISILFFISIFFLGYLGIYVHNVHHSGAGPRFISWPHIWIIDCGPESSIVSNIRPSLPLTRTIDPEVFCPILINVAKPLRCIVIPILSASVSSHIELSTRYLT